MTERNEHFKGFAKLLFDELDKRPKEIWFGFSPGDHKLPSDYEQIVKEIIAQRAYDLVSFASECINDKQLEEGMRLTPEYMIECIPDLTEWPTTAD
jgi:hypothetical protein